MLVLLCLVLSLFENNTLHLFHSEDWLKLFIIRWRANDISIPSAVIHQFLLAILKYFLHEYVDTRQHVITIFDSLSILEGDIRTTSQSTVLTIYVIIFRNRKVS